MSADFDPEEKKVIPPFVKKKGVNNLISAASLQIQFNNILASIKLAGDTETKAETIQRLNSNIGKLQSVKALYATVFTQHQSKLQDYKIRLDNAKQQFSREMYGSKLSKEKMTMLNLLQRMQMVDQSIQNVEKIRDALFVEKTPEPTESVESSELQSA
jgi:hypothetical protein